MDPEAAWKELAAEFESRDDVDRCEELALALLRWLRKGGFSPLLTGCQTFDRHCVMATCNSVLRNVEIRRQKQRRLEREAKPQQIDDVLDCQMNDERDDA